MQRTAAIFSRVLAFGVGLALIFAAQLTLSPLSRTIWLIPGLVLMLCALIGLLPSYRPIESRVPIFFGYGSAFTALYLLSVEPGVPGSMAERVSNLSLPVLSAIFTLSLVFYWRDRKNHPANEWLCVGLCLGLLVAFFSGTSGGTGGGSWDRWLMHEFGITAGQAEFLVIAFRKTIHFTYYGVLAAVALRAAMAEKIRPSGAIAFAILFSASFGAFDEWRQLMTPDRTGSVIDFLIDVVGACSFATVLSRRSPAYRRQSDM